MSGALLLFCWATAIGAPAQTLTTLASFNGTNGSEPISALVQGSDGNFYGTTIYGGVNNRGTIFKVTPSGTLTNLYNFCPQLPCNDGWQPYTGLVQGSDGNFYGVASRGGPTDHGTIFRITPGGTLTTIYGFCASGSCTDGSYPHGTLVQSSDGKFYGTTLQGGANAAGTVFKVTSGGTLTTLYSFCSQANCADGAYPYDGVIRATDGKFYGTVAVGGNANCNNGCGTVFKITSSGTYTLLHSFTYADGANPQAGLVQASDGNFYGTTAGGGSSNCSTGCGTVFKMTAAGSVTSLYSFCEQTNCPDGSVPLAGLAQAMNGNLYGTTQVGGTSNSGVIFQVTPSGAVTTAYKFCSVTNCTDGQTPEGALILATDGNLYGATAEGGANQKGTVFRFSGMAGVAVQFVPAPPCRVVDTRQTHMPIQGGTAQSFAIPQLGGCNIPATAAAYSLNVTAVPHEDIDYLTIWPTGQSQPLVSTMNSPDGRIKANAAIIPAGTNGAVSVFSTNTTDVILDINGYFETPGAQTLQYYPLTPCRIVDTRNNHDGGLLHAGQERDYAVQGHCEIPSNAAAYSFNVTVLPAPGGLDYLTVWPQGGTRPVVSTLNDNTGTVVANAAIVPAGTSGEVAFYPNNNNTDLLLDTNGYFATPGQGGYSLYPVTPCRAYDSRNNNGPPFTGERTVNIVGSQCAPPSTAQAYVFNATVVPYNHARMGYLTLWPDSETQPVVSTLNAYDGFITSNMAIVPNVNGSIDAYADGMTHLILDISGYFAP